ncbi:putative ribonuclease H-like domain-containing protein [Tanacetum coccineum]
MLTGTVQLDVDLDFLNNLMYYILFGVEKSVNVDASTQDSDVAGSSGKDKGPTQGIICFHYNLIVQGFHSPKDNDVQDTEVAANKEEQHQMKESEQDLQDELEKMVTQELAAKVMDDVSRQAFEGRKGRIATQKKQLCYQFNILVLIGNLSNKREDSKRLLQPQQALEVKFTNRIEQNLQDHQTVSLHVSLQEEPKTCYKPYKDDSWVESMQEELLQFKYRRFGYYDVHMGKRQEEVIDYDEVFALVARIEAISAFLYCTMEEEGFIKLLELGMEDTFFFLMDNGFREGTRYKTFVYHKNKSDIMLVQVYVDDIIFGSTKKSMCTEFEECMHKRFQMSSMGELTFFLGLQVKQQPDGIFISQDKYVVDILKKFDFYPSE